MTLTKKSRENELHFGVLQPNARQEGGASPLENTPFVGNLLIGKLLDKIPPVVLENFHFEYWAKTVLIANFDNFGLSWFQGKTQNGQQAQIKNFYKKKEKDWDLNVNTPTGTWDKNWHWITSKTQIKEISGNFAYWSFKSKTQIHKFFKCKCFQNWMNAYWNLDKM